MQRAGHGGELMKALRIALLLASIFLTAPARALGPFGLGGAQQLFPRQNVSTSSLALTLGDKHGGVYLGINGFGLLGTTSVTVGGSACTSVAPQSSALVTCRTPSLSAGTYDVVLTVGGRSSTLSSAFEAWYPDQISSTARIYDADIGVTNTSGAASAWADQGSAALNLSQSTSGFRPTIVANEFGGTHTALKFDQASSQRLSIPGGGSAGTAPDRFNTGFSAFACLKYQTADTGGATNGGPIVDELDSTQYAGLLGVQANTFVQTYNFSDTSNLWELLNFNGGYNDGAPHVLGATHLASSGVEFIYGDNTQVGTATSTYNSHSYVGWDTIGRNLENYNLTGLLLGVVIAPDVISSGERSKVQTWFHSKGVSGGYETPQLTASAAWHPRDGGELVYLQDTGLFYLVGGWNPDNGSVWANFTSNEVWTSPDLVSWTNILAQNNGGTSTQFSQRHGMPVLVYNYGGVDYIYVIGGDPLDSSLKNDVWRSTDGVTWTEVTASAGWSARFAQMAWAYNGALYVAGGQTVLNDPTTALQDVWKSTDGGATWTQLSDAPWAKRGFAFGGPVMGGYAWLCGGGTYHTTPSSRTYYNDCWKFDGTTWTSVTSSAAWDAREYQQVIALDGNLWVLNGYNTSVGNHNDAWWSPDGSTWTQYRWPTWPASHADGMIAKDHAIWFAGGNHLTDQTFKLDTAL
jgi:hypothetical protein